MRSVNKMSTSKFDIVFETTLMDLLDGRDFQPPWPPLWSSGQSSWLQIQRSGFDSRRYKISWEVKDLERGPLSLMSSTEELLGRKSSDFGLENREYGHRNLLSWPCGTLYPQNLALTSLTRGGHSVGLVCLWTQATQFSFFLIDRHHSTFSCYITSYRVCHVCVF
jgi:hypothetical protein